LYVDDGDVVQLPCVPLIPSVAIFACLTLLVANSTKVGWIGCLILLIFGNSIEFLFKSNSVIRDGPEKFHIFNTLDAEL